MLNYKEIPSEELFYPYEYKRQPLHLSISWEVILCIIPNCRCIHYNNINHDDSICQFHLN